jgi:sterol desaturase/sphingolipid hydroxylase (fatty acid hydroxylase superfamily)
MFDFLTQQYSQAQEALYHYVLEPLLYQFGLMHWAEDAFDGSEWLMLGLLQIFLIAFGLRLWEKLSPAELQVRHAKGMAADVFYTFFHRLGVFHAIIFIIFADFFFQFEGQLHDWRFERLNVENWWPGVTSIPWVSFLIYLIILDFIDYGYHRATHRFQWWWQLHALHHSQTTMTAWSDNRNHFLDDVMRALVFAFCALIIGVSPGQFILLVVISQFVQSWQHANINIHLGWAKYVLVSPIFHRRHHAIRLGYEASNQPGVLGGCNFGVLFPWWDMIFKTANFDRQIHPTGVEHLQLSSSVLQHQWQSLKSAWQTFFKRTHSL